MENQVRELLRDIAEDIPPQREVPPTLRPRARRRIVATVGLTVLVVVAVAVGGFEAARSIAGASSVPASPAPSVEPSSLGAADVLYGGTDLWARDPDTGEGRTIVDAQSLPEGPGSITTAAWSADGEWVAFRFGNGSRGGSLWVVDAAGGGLRRLAPVNGYSQWAWSPTAHELVLAHDGALSLFDPTTGRATALGTPVGTNDYWGEVVHRLAWSPDGSRIAYDGGPNSGSVYAVDVQTGRHSLIVDEPSGWGSIRAIDWSPDGAHLAIVYYASPDSSGQGLYVAKADGSDAHLVADAPEVLAAWSPDGNRLAYTTISGDRRSDWKLWTVPGDGSVPSLVVSDCCVSGGVGVVWSADGSQIALATEHQAGTPDVHIDHLIVNAEGAADPKPFDDLMYGSWEGGQYFCGCYG